MRVLLDTNVVLDALLGRDPWRADAEAVWKAHADGRIDAYVTASSVTDIFYVARRSTGHDAAWAATVTLLEQLGVVSVGRAELSAAAAIGSGDFEDHLQAVCAAGSRCDFIVTRDVDGFAGGAVPAIDPPGLLSRLAAAG